MMLTRQEDLDKANQALKAAVDDLMAQEEIRGLIIGEPSFAGLVRAEQYRVYAARQLYDAAAEAVGGALCPRHPGEAALRSRRGARAGTDLAGIAAAGQRKPGGRDLKWTAALCVVHKAPGDKAALLLPLRHLFFHHFHRADFGQQRGTAAADCRRGTPAR